MKKPYEISLRLYGNVQTQSIEYVQGDVDVYPLTIKLLGKDGKPFPLPENAAAVVNFSARDGLGAASALRGYADIVDDERGVLLYTFKGEELYYPGRVSAAVEVLSGSERLTWPGFVFTVIPSLAGADTEPPGYMQPWTSQVDERLDDLSVKIENIDVTGGGVDKSDLDAYVPKSEKGEPNGVATLDPGGEVVQNAKTATEASGYARGGSIHSMFVAFDQTFGDIYSGSAPVGKARAVEPDPLPGNSKYLGTDTVGNFGYHDFPDMPGEKLDAYIPNAEKGAPDGVATLDFFGEVKQKAKLADEAVHYTPDGRIGQSFSQLFTMLEDFIPNSEKGEPSGVATLDSAGEVIQNAKTATYAAKYTADSNIGMKFLALDRLTEYMMNGTVTVAKARELDPLSSPGNSKYLGTDAVGNFGYHGLTDTPGPKGDKGDTGPAGPKGADGYTPVKGVDYFDGPPGNDGTSIRLIKASGESDALSLSAADPSNIYYWEG